MSMVGKIGSGHITRLVVVVVVVAAIVVLEPSTPSHPSSHYFSTNINITPYTMMIPRVAFLLACLVSSASAFAPALGEFVSKRASRRILDRIPAGEPSGPMAATSHCSSLMLQMWVAALSVPLLLP